MMADHPTMHAVFVRGQEHPDATFADADRAARYARDTHGDQAVVVPVEGNNLAAASRQAAESFPAEAPAAAAEPGTTADPDAALRGEIRSRLVEERRRARVEEEVRKEIDEEDRADRPDQRQVPRAAAARPERA
jgi:hypothetical protein